MQYKTELVLNKVDAYRKAGQWQAGIELCESFFRDSTRNRNSDDLLEAILRLGFLYSTKGDRELAEEYHELAVAIGTLVSDFSRVGRAQNGLGILHQRAGEIEASERLYRSALLNAGLGKDSATSGDIHVNLGILANIRGDHEQALLHYKNAVNEYEISSTGDRLGRVYNNLGMLYIDLKDYAQAAAALDHALKTCRANADVTTEGIVLTNRTELFLALKDLEQARGSCDEAFEIASRIGNENLKAAILTCYGVIYRESNKPYLSELHLRRAVDLGRALANLLIEADACRELALVLRSQDRNREALECLNRAHTLFAELQARHDQDDIASRFSQLEQDFLNLVTLWGESIEAKDHYTRGHCQRVADYACLIAEHAGVIPRDLVWFRMGAFLHDVGKTEVPSEILNKPGRLTDEERATIEQHTVAGDEILAPIEFPWDIRPMVRSHHERWDGGGYPDGLLQEEIPFTARILRIADVFDALTTNRSYREELSPEQALEIMIEDEGSFDPHLFGLFKGLFPEIIELLDRHKDREITGAIPVTTHRSL